MVLAGAGGRKSVPAFQSGSGFSPWVIPLFDLYTNDFLFDFVSIQVQKSPLLGGFFEMKKVILFILISIFAIVALNFFSNNADTREQQNLLSSVISDIN